jgi:hypothetical protein
MNSKWIATSAIVSTLALACSETHENPDTEGCEHLREGPAVALTASAGADTAAAVAADHQRYDIALISVTGGMGGFVKYAAPEATDYLFFLGADVPVQFLDAAGATVTPEESASSSTACSEIKGRHLVPLEVGTYGLSFGPTAQTSVSVVVEEAAHEPH